MTTVSVAMATFNGEAFLAKQLDSIEAQTLPPSEIVICDDGSSDGTCAVVERFAARSRVAVRLHRNPERLGYRRNFMKAAELCRGNLVAFCDQDDVWLPEKLATVVPHFDAPDVTIAIHNAHVIDASEAEIGRMSERSDTVAADPLSVDPWKVQFGFAIVFRRRLLSLARDFEVSIDPYHRPSIMSHDQWIVMLGAIYGRSVMIGTPLALYRQHGRNVVGWHRPEPFGNRLRFWMENRSAAYRHCATAAGWRERMLAGIGPSLPEPDRTAARDGAAAYRALQAAYMLRAALYAAPTVTERLRVFLRLLRQGSYSETSTFTFGRKGLAKDLVFGLPLGPHGGATTIRDGDASCHAGRKRGLATA